MKVQVRHVHARIHRTTLGRLRRQFVDIGDVESVTRRSTDDGSYRLSLVREGISAALIHRFERKGCDVVLCAYLRWLRQRNSLARAVSHEKSWTTEKQEP